MAQLLVSEYSIYWINLEVAVISFLVLSGSSSEVVDFSTHLGFPHFFIEPSSQTFWVSGDDATDRPETHCILCG